MTCTQNHLLSAYVDGELTPGESTAMRDHLAVCPACAAEADAMRAIGRLMGLARDSALGEPSEAVLRRLRLHVRGLVETSDAGLLRIARVFTGVAASVLIAGLWLLHHTAAPANRQPTGPSYVSIVTPSMPVQEVLAGVENADPSEPASRETVLEKLTGVEDPAQGAGRATAPDDEMP